MFPSFMFLVLSTSQYSAVQAHSDSVFIYNTYTESVKVFEQATEPGQWKAVDDSVALVTAASFLRLHKYNKQVYAPVDELNREGIGVALVFPHPSDFTAPDGNKADNQAQNDAKQYNKTPGSEREIAFKVLDEQTHFLIGANGKERTPYVVMNYYAKGRILVKSEKLDPITLKPIETEATASSVVSK